MLFPKVKHRRFRNVLLVVDLLWFCIKDAIKQEWDERRYRHVLRVTDPGNPASYNCPEGWGPCSCDEDGA